VQLSALPNKQDVFDSMFEGMPPLMTAKELSSVIRRKEKTLYHDAKNERIPHVRIQSSVLFPTKLIVIWLRERNRRPLPVNGKQQ
jgi:hypothetical protein